MIDIEKEDALDNSLMPTNQSSTAELINEGNELTNKIIAEEDPKKLEDLTQLFTMHQKKRDMIRTNKLSNLLEVIDDEVIMRFTSLPETFDNDQILKYMDSTQKAITNIKQSINQMPTIQINNQTNEIHISQSGLDRESRAKVLSAVNLILKDIDTGNKEDVIDVEVNEDEKGS